ncbi:MAG: CoA transferase [Actinobacteria bacterium]|nr:CoA transferase [Actinomycetota bacterium]
MRSAAYVKFVDPSLEHREDGHMGIFPTADDRWFLYRGGCPHHFARQLEVLGCGPDSTDIAAATAKWNGLDLEEAVHAGGAVGGMVRSYEEWAAHPQAQALDALPMFELLKIGDTEPMAFPPGERPLSGVRVIDVTRVIAGPCCGRTLAEHGADVLRIGMADPPDSDAILRDTGHGKRHCALDLKSAEDAKRLHELVADADVFIQGYRPGAVARLGFSPEQVAAERPGIVYVTISAFGHVGPWRDRRGFDSVLEAVSGLAHEVRDRETGAPRLLLSTPLDYTTGYLTAFLTMVALRRRATEGGSYHIRVSLAQTSRWIASLTRADAELVASQPPDLPAARLEQLLATSTTPWGELRHLAPIARMSRTPTRWDLPTVPIGHDQPAWSS